MEPHVRRRRLLYKKFRALPKIVLADMLVEIYDHLWMIDSKDYPNPRQPRYLVDGAVINDVAGTFVDRKISPKEIP